MGMERARGVSRASKLLGLGERMEPVDKGFELDGVEGGGGWDALP